MTRVEYMYDEDVKIVKFLARHEAWELTNGNRIWMLMEQEKICPQRTFQSLRNRFLRSIKRRLLTDFSSIVNSSPLPRHFKSSLPQAAKLKDKIETKKNASLKQSSSQKPKSGELRSRKENVSPLRPESPSLVEKLTSVLSPKKANNEIVDSCEIGGWTQPHTAAREEKTEADGNKLRKRRLYNDDEDLFLDEEEEPTQDSSERHRSESPSNEVHQDTPVHEMENVSQELPFVSLNIVNNSLTQVVLVEPSVESDKEPLLKTVESDREPPLKTVKRRNQKNRLFQKRINIISQKLAQNQRMLSKERRKNQQLVKFITDCLQESANPEAVTAIPEIVTQVSIGDPGSSTLLSNMLMCLDENSRNNILKFMKKDGKK